MNVNHTGKNIFRRVRRSGGDDLKLSGTSLNVLLELDGKSNLDQIMQRSGMPYNEVQAGIDALMKQGLIEPVDQAEPIIPIEIFSKIEAAFVKAVGPVGKFLLDENIEDLGHSLEKFPLHLLPELISNIAQEIRRQDISISFKRQMIELIKTLNRQ